MPVGDDSPRTEERGFFVAWSEGLFKVDAQGRQLFFPWGVLGRGYVVPSGPERERLVNAQDRLSKLSLIATIVLLTLVRPPLLALLVLPPFYLGYLVWVRRTTRGWPPAGERLSMSEALSAQSRALSRPLLWTLLLGSLLVVADAARFLAIRPEEWLPSTTAILVFGLCSAMFARMIWLRPNP